MIVDFRLKVFQTVARRLSFTRAAHELFISQPAVTKHINELEKSIGKPLFNRHGNNISLTMHGDLLLKYTNNILGSYQELDEKLNQLTGSVSGELRIGASTTIAQYILPKILAKFKMAYRETDISLINDNTLHIEKAVLDKKIDMGIIEGSAANPLLHYEPFIEDEIVLATRTDNPYIKGNEIRSSQIKTIPLVVRERGSGTLEIIEKALGQKHIERNDLKIELALGSTESMKHYLLHSNAYAFLSIYAISDEMEQHKLKIIEIKDMDITREFHFVCLHGQHAGIVSRFKSFCLIHHNLK
ncbi:MAG: LysR substrate-binding domain-containing protein [Chitinophagaceae bacterium]